MKAEREWQEKCIHQWSRSVPKGVKAKKLNYMYTIQISEESFIVNNSHINKQFFDHSQLLKHCENILHQFGFIYLFCQSQNTYLFSVIKQATHVYSLYGCWKMKFA